MPLWLTDCMCVCVCVQESNEWNPMCTKEHKAMVGGEKKGEEQEEVLAFVPPTCKLQK